MVSNEPPPLPDGSLDAALAPFGRSTMLPPQAYTDPAVFAWEKQHLFGGWQCVALTADLPSPGDQRAVRLGDSSVVLTRGQDGVVRGFVNACRHRAHELLPCTNAAGADSAVTGPVSNGRAITCPYHAWSYRLDGELVAAPGYRDVPGFDPQDYSLVGVRVAEWHGYLFADPSGCAVDLADWLGDVDTRVAGHSLGRLVVAARHEYVVAANWKTITENYQECYHCPSIHPQLCVVSPPDSGDNWEGTGAWVGGWLDLAGGAVTMSMDGHSDGVTIPGLPPWAATRVDYLGVFPNLLISLHPDYVMTHRMIPLAADSTWVECSWAFPPEAIAAPGFSPDYAVDFWHVTNSQDWAACESVQRGLASGAARPGPLSSQEDAVYQFVTMVARSYRGLSAHLSPKERSWSAPRPSTPA
jgi:glycine betaine catabolism A